MKTAVEWLIDTINKINHDYEVGIIDETLWSIQTYDAHKQAKEMEKENIIKHSVELSKILMNNPIEISGKTHQELITDYFKNKFKNK